MTAPERITHVSQTQFSVVRHYGGCTINGAHYFYNPITDELVRDDVLKRDMAEKKAAENAAKKLNADRQESLL